MMFTHRTFTLTSLGLAATVILAVCSSKLKDEVTEGGKMALVVLDAGEATTEVLSKAVGAFTKETKVGVDIKPVSNVSWGLVRGVTAEPSTGIVVLDPVQLSSYASALHSWDRGAAVVKDMNPALLTSTTRQKKTVTTPRDASMLILYVNTSLWSTANLSESDYPTTWGRLDQVAAKLTSGGVVGPTPDASYTRVSAFLVRGGGGLTSADGTRAATPSEDPVAGLTQVRMLLFSGSAGWDADLPAGPAADAFDQGQAAMVIGTEALIKTLADIHSGISYRVVELPAGSGSKGTPQFPTFYEVVEASKHKADTIKLVEHFIVTKRQVTPVGATGTVPAGKPANDTWEGKHADQAALLTDVEYSQPIPPAFGTLDVTATFDNEPPGLAGGDLTAILGSTQANLQAVLS